MRSARKKISLDARLVGCLSSRIQRMLIVKYYSLLLLRVYCKSVYYPCIRNVIIFQFCCCFSFLGSIPPIQLHSFKAWKCGSRDKSILRVNIGAVSHPVCAEGVFKITRSSPGAFKLRLAAKVTGMVMSLIPLTKELPMCPSNSKLTSWQVIRCLGVGEEMWGGLAWQRLEKEEKGVAIYPPQPPPP